MEVSKGFILSLLLALLVPNTTCSSPPFGLERFFEQGKTYVYSALGEITVPDIAPEKIYFSYMIEITPIDAKTIELHPRKIIIGTGHAVSRLPHTVYTQLSTPVQVILGNDGTIERVMSPSTMPTWALNIKKEQIHRFIFSLSPEGNGHNRNDNHIRHDHLQTNQVRKRDYMTDNNWQTWEKSVLGDCQVSYELRQITTQEMDDNDSSSSDSSREEQKLMSIHCSEPRTKFYKMTRVVNAESCRIKVASNNMNITLESEYTLCGKGQNITILKIEGMGNLRNLGEYKETFNLVKTKRQSHSRGEMGPALSTSNLPVEFNLDRTLPRLHLSPGRIISDVKDSVKKVLCVLIKCRTDTSADTSGLDSRIPGFRACLESNGVPSDRLVDPVSNSSGYEILNLQWNTRIAKVYPVAYFLPLTSMDVQFAVQCGVRVDIHLIPNSGGHSYEAISWGTNSTIVVDFREMQKVELAGKIGNNVIAKVQPGALVGPINAQLWQLGKLAIPMGNCLTVGIGGHAIGGGVGFFTALYGLTIDRVIEYELVNAKGELVIANGTLNPDLFWALKGVGAGYIGIATSFKIKTFNAGQMKISAAQLVYPIKDFAKVGAALQNWMDWTSENDPTIFSSVSITNDNWTSHYPATAKGPIGGIIVTTLHIFDPELNPHSNETFLQKLDEIFPLGYRNKGVIFPSYIEFVVGSGYAPVRMSITVQQPPSSRGIQERHGRSSSSPTFIQKIVEIGHLEDPILDKALEFIERGPSSTQFNVVAPSPANPIIAKLMAMKKEIAMPRHFDAKSFFVKRKLKSEELEKLGQILLRIPNNRCWILISSEMGAVHHLQNDVTAYVHRDSLIDFSVHIEAIDSDGDLEEARMWFQEFWTGMQSFDGGNTYQNYPDLSIINYLERYYGINLNRLVNIKRTSDSKNYFRNQISLPIAIN